MTDAKVKIGVALLWLLASCAPAPKPPARPEPAPPPAQIEQAPVKAAPQIPDLCDQLQALMLSIRQGFDPYRGGVLPGGLTSGELVPVGFRSCTVEGRNFPAAEYVCRGAETPNLDPSLLTDEFSRLDAKLSSCFAKATWYPANWAKGELHTFAGGEWRRLWRQTGALPKPAVALKIEEDFRLRRFFLRLAIHALR